MLRKPPATRRQDLVEEVHGVQIADPYRWLEYGESGEVRRWVEAQNEHTRRALASRPGRQELKKRLASLLSIGTLDPPIVRDDRHFFKRREGADQDQPILYVRSGLAGEDRILVDTNRMRADRTMALDWWYPSEGGRLLAYGLSSGGDEKSTLRVLDVDTGEHLDDVIPHTRYCSIAWLPDESGFYYTRYPAPGEVPPGEENYNRHVFFHRLGSDPASDPKIYGESRKPEEMIGIDISRDGRYLVVTVQEGWTRSDLYIRDLHRDEGPFMPVAEGLDALFAGKLAEGTLYILTNWEAPRYRLLGVDPESPHRANWRELIPEGRAVLVDAEQIGKRIVALYLEDASSRLSLHSVDGAKLRDIALPALGTVNAISGRRGGSAVFFDFSSFTIPPAVHRYDFESDRSEIWGEVRADVDLSNLVVEQFFFPSRDGTRLSIFLVHRAGIEREGSNPTVLCGYGGFNISMTPEFSRSVVAWLERGGVYAVANLRGGGEYGEEWHRAGMRENKQNVFDDFIAASEWLIERRYTDHGHLAILGGSNGGLLVGAALTQRPDLFRAVVCAVPLLDMVRYHNFRIARLWIPEYGSAEEREQFCWLHAYSPYHRVRAGTPYPAVLLTTAEGDSRVDPMHARKMAALLQASTAVDLPIFLRTETKAGHGVGKPVSMQIETATDIWSFLLWQLGLEKGDARLEIESAG